MNTTCEFSTTDTVLWWLGVLHIVTFLVCLRTIAEVRYRMRRGVVQSVGFQDPVTDI